MGSGQQAILGGCMMGKHGLDRTWLLKELASGLPSGLGRKEVCSSGKGLASPAASWALMDFSDAVLILY